MMLSWLSLFRLCALGWSIFCAILLLGLGAHTLSESGPLELPTFAWAGLAVATAVLSLLAITPMLVVDQVRTGAFTSMIVVELSVLGFLGVLFLATGGSAAANASDFWVNCNVWNPASARTVCGEVPAAAAFGFLGWLALWAYTGTLLLMLIIRAQKGHYVWRQSVKEINWRGGNVSAPAVYDPEAKDGAPIAASAYPPSMTQPAGTYPQV